MDCTGFQVVTMARRLALKEQFVRYGAGFGEEFFAKGKVLITDFISRRRQRPAGRPLR